MTRRKTIAGLSLLAVFAFCAFAAQGASAAWQNATNLTAYECVSLGGVKDFSDAHCDHKVAEGTGTFGHVAIANGVSTNIESSNKETKNNTTEREHAVLKGELAGVPVEITCAKAEPDANATSFIKNTGTGTTHQVEGTSAVNFTECVLSGITGCSVAEPITVESKFHGVEEPTNNPRTMALEFEADTSADLLAVEFQGANCPWAGATFEVAGIFRGTASGTPTNHERYSGATIKFEGGNGMEALELGGNPATFEAILTTKKAGGSAISLTTPTP
jgi:hypothetical protein